MNREVNIELLESYLAGDISADMVLDQEGHALSSDELKVALNDYEDTVIQIEGAALKADLVDLQATLENDMPKSKRGLWYKIAASVLILFTAGFLWQQSNQTPDFEDYFDHFPQLRNFRAQDGAGEKGMESYSRKLYAESYSLLNQMSESDLDPELKFYLAVSAIGSSQFEEAVALLEELSWIPDNKYYQQITWYLALAYWQNDEPEKALSRLRMIKADQFKYQEALELIGDLN